MVARTGSDEAKAEEAAYLADPWVFHKGFLCLCGAIVIFGVLIWAGAEDIKRASKMVVSDKYLLTVVLKSGQAVTIITNEEICIDLMNRYLQYLDTGTKGMAGGYALGVTGLDGKMACDMREISSLGFAKIKQ